MRIKEIMIAVTMAVVLVSFGLMPTVRAQPQRAQSQRAYRNNDTYMRQLFRQIETRTDRFSTLLPGALDRSRVDGTRREDDVNKLVTEFEQATDQLKERFDSRQSTAMDAQMVLQQGARINRFMNNRRLNVQTERAWTLLKTDLDRLATAYNVARNWTTMEWPTQAGGPVLSGYDAMLTGTYRLNAGLSNNPRTVVATATRSLRVRERRQIADNLITRLTPPEIIALERRGNSVTLASTKSPRLTLDVDGLERNESYPNGRPSQVRATFNGDQFTVVSNGDRTNDFTVTFAPLNDGRRLLVTRQIYSEQLNLPVIVESYYDRSSNVAQWDLYKSNDNYPNTGAVRGNFLIPKGTQVVAVLNENLSTQNTRDNDRFTMTVREPYQYRNAVIEGHVTGVGRGGRISGRSEMTLNFDRIRTSDGNSYNFGGIVNNVRGTNNEDVRVDNEGAVQEENRTNTTVQRTAIGTALGALIGAISGGGKGAAIGAVVGAGAGAGSVYVQGRDDLSLTRGAEVTIQASAP